MWQTSRKLFWSPCIFLSGIIGTFLNITILKASQKPLLTAFIIIDWRVVCLFPQRCQQLWKSKAEANCVIDHTCHLYRLMRRRWGWPMKGCGPYSMFNKLVHQWADTCSSVEVAVKVKRFFRYYINTHKMTVLAHSLLPHRVLQVRLLDIDNSIFCLGKLWASCRLYTYYSGALI